MNTEDRMRISMQDERINSAKRGGGAGFTLIEVLVVLGIIAIVATISLVVAGRVTASSKERTTSDVLRVLDAMGQSFVQDFGRIPTTFTDAEGTQFPIIDARGNAGSTVTVGYAKDDRPEPSLALYLLTLEQRGHSAEESLKGINKKFIRRTTERELTPYGTNAKQNVAYSPTLQRVPIRTDKAPAALPDDNSDDPSVPDPTPSTVHLGLTVLDTWNNAIRFVHPAYHGGYGNGYGEQPDGTWQTVTRLPLVRSLSEQGGAARPYAFRRCSRAFDPTVGGSIGTGDADEGIAPGALGYFYSVGEDGDAGTREDNVYSTQPVFPVETRTAKVQ